MTGFCRNTEAEMLRIGAEINAARDASPPADWKTLEKKYRRSRWRLRCYALAARESAGENNVASAPSAPSAPSTA